MKDFESQLVSAIKKKREEKGLSIRALSATVGVSFSTLARIERGDGLPDNNSKIRLLEWLGEKADEAGLKFDNVAFVHFRAAKNVQSSTIQALLKAAEAVRRREINQRDAGEVDPVLPKTTAEEAVALSKEDLEKAAEKFRKDLKLSDDQPLESLKLDVEDVQVHKLSHIEFLDSALVRKLKTTNDDWSAMSVPLDLIGEKWAILLNDSHSVERQRVTILEEFWHIFLGHKLTKIARVAEVYGRTYDEIEEHDAYYLASASLLPRISVAKAIKAKKDATEIAKLFGTSKELVEYRIKRLGLWRDYVGKKVSIATD